MSNRFNTCDEPCELGTGTGYNQDGLTMQHPCFTKRMWDRNAVAVETGSTGSTLLLAGQKNTDRHRG